MDLTEGIGLHTTVKYHPCSRNRGGKPASAFSKSSVSAAGVAAVAGVLVGAVLVLVLSIVDGRVVIVLTYRSDLVRF